MLTLCCAQAQAKTLRQFSTGNYTVHTDVPTRHARPFAKHMDKVFDEYKRRFEKLNFKSRKVHAKMDLYLFENKQSYEKFLASKGIPAKNTGGMFVINPKVNGLFTYIKGRPVRQTLSTLQHEGFHHFAFAYIGSDLPIWVNEGIAQFFEDGVLINERFHLEIPSARRLNQIKDAIANDHTLAFADLIIMSNRQWGNNVHTNPALATLQYDQAWSMVYYLITANGKLRAAFNQYLIAVGKGIDSQIAFKNAFTLRRTSFAQLTKDFETAWKRHTTKLEPNTLSQVTDNMNFLAHGLLWIQKKGRPAPKSLAELRSVLQGVNYRISRTVNGTQTTFFADNESLYRYQLANGSTPMLSLKSNKSTKLPPTITAPGLKPTPTLVWYHMDKELVYDVTYK